MDEEDDFQDVTDDREPDLPYEATEAPPDLTNAEF
jgi:hypothetical protein